MILFISCLIGNGGDDLGEVGVYPVEEIVVIRSVIRSAFSAGIFAGLRCVPPHQLTVTI